MKRIVFLIVGILLVLGLVLPGCAGGGGGGGTAYHNLATAGKLTIGVTGDMDYVQGQHAVAGAQLAATDQAPFAVGNVSGITVQITSIDTDEVDNPGSAAGTAAVAAALPNVDFIVGGFRTEGVNAYLPTIMADKMVFIGCGAATESIAHLTVTHYSSYKYFFRGTPMNDFFVNHSMGRMETAVLGIALSYKLFMPQMAVLAEGAEWTKDGREMTQALIAAGGYNISPDPYLIPSLASDSQVNTVLNQMNSDGPPNIIITILSGPVGVNFQNLVRNVFPTELVLGINVEAQAKGFPSLLSDPWDAEEIIFLDGWAAGVNITSNTAAFLSGFAAANGGALPLYTAGTYDAVLTLVKAVIAKASVGGGTVRWLPDDIVTYMEGSIALTAAGRTGVYPNWDGSTTGTHTLYPGKTLVNAPALSQSQVLALYPWLAAAKYSNGTAIHNWTYSSNDWTMPPNTSHDLVYGVEYDSSHAWSTAIASQWQNVTGNLTKVCIWPTAALTYGTPLYTVNDLPTFLYVLGLGTINASTLYGLQGAELWDQYGWWNFAYPGTGSVALANFISGLP